MLEKKEELKFLIKENHARKSELAENMKKTYQIVWDMCTDAMHTKLRGVEGFSDMEKDLDALKLLEEIKKIVFNFEEKRYKQHNMYMAWQKFYDLRQKPDETVHDWYERFRLQVKVVESVGGCFG